MATYLDHPYQGTPYVSGVPVDLIMKVGMAKQAKYDQNVANINDQLGRLDQYNIVKPSDKQVVGQKMDELVGNLNKLGQNSNIGDSRVYGQLSGLVSGFYNDKDIYGAIADNQRYNASVKAKDKMIEDDPELANPVNEYIFNKRSKEWMDNPNSKWNSSYTPYYDKQKWAKTIIDKSLANPEVRKEIDYVHDTEGNVVLDEMGQPMRRGIQEIKEVTKDKLYNQLMSGMDSKVQSQMMMEREYMIDQMDPTDVTKSLGSQLTNARAELKDIETKLLSTDLSDKDKAAGNALKTKLTDYINKNRDMVDYITKTGDVSKYYTPSKFMDDYVTEQANAWEQHSLGDYKDDPYNLERFKHDLGKEMESYKKELEFTEKVKTLALGIDKNGKLLVNKNGSLTTPSEFEDHMLTDLNLNGKTSINSNEMVNLFNSGSDVKPDGSFDIEVHDQPIYLDIQPTLKALGVDADNAKSLGLNKFTSALDNWQKDDKGGHINFKIPYNPNGVDWDSYAKKYNVSIADLKKAAKCYPATGCDISIKRNLTDFLKSDTGKKLAQSIKTETGLDVSSAKDRQLVESAAANPAVVEALSEIGKMMSNPKLGRVNVVPADGDNVFTSNDGNPYTKVFAQVTQRQLGKVFGKNYNLGPDGYNKLVDAGIIINTGRKDADKEDIYEIPIISKVNVDLASAHQRYLGKHSNKTYEENLGTYNDHWNNRARDLSNIKPLVGLAPIKISDLLAKHINSLDLSTEDIQKAAGLINTWTRQLEGNGTPPNRETKLDILKEVTRMLSWNGIDEAPKENDYSQYLTPSKQVNPISTLRTPGNEYEFKTRIKEVKKGIAAMEQDKRGYKSINPYSGAMGKYQFTNSTLRDSVYNKYYKDTYRSYDAFKGAFINSPDLQEDVMDKYLMDIGKEGNWNLGQTALVHFVGKPTLNELMSGKKKWNESPTADTPNATPIKYLSTFMANLNK